MIGYWGDTVKVLNKLFIKKVILYQDIKESQGVDYLSI